MVTAYFGGLHYWWPKITGRLYSEYWARAAAVLIFGRELAQSCLALPKLDVAEPCRPEAIALIENRQP